MIPMLITHKRAVNRRAIKEGKKLAMAVEEDWNCQELTIIVGEPFLASSPFPGG